jgi:hypothetical protein
VTDASDQRRARYKVLSGDRTLRLFRVVSSVQIYRFKSLDLSVATIVAWRWRAASTEASQLCLIVAGFGRAPKTFPKRA